MQKGPHFCCWSEVKKKQICIGAFSCCRRYKWRQISSSQGWPLHRQQNLIRLSEHKHCRAWSHDAHRGDQMHHGSCCSLICCQNMIYLYFQWEECDQRGMWHETRWWPKQTWPMTPNVSTVSREDGERRRGKSNKQARRGCSTVIWVYYREVLLWLRLMLFLFAKIYILKHNEFLLCQTMKSLPCRVDSLVSQDTGSPM